MFINQVLLLLLGSLPANNKLLLSWTVINLWQKGTLDTLLESKLIKPISNTTNIQCQACENNCAVDVYPHEYPHKTLYYAVCEDPVMHDQMGRMTVPIVQLKQWHFSIKQLALVIAKLLDFDSNNDFQDALNKTRLGMIKTPTGRKWVSLYHAPLSLEVNQELLPLSEILFFEKNKLCLDMDRINTALLIVQPTVTKPYEANTDKKSIRKSNTQAKYQIWQDTYEQLKIENPNKVGQAKKTKRWYAHQISKLDIAEGASIETIRKILNN